MQLLIDFRRNRMVSYSPRVFFLCALTFTLLSFAGCGESVSAVSGLQIGSNPETVSAQSSVRAGSKLAFTATKNGVAVTGGQWSVSSGAGEGTIDANGMYSAPASVPAVDPVLVTYTLNGVTASISVSVLNPLPVISAVTPNVSNVPSTPIVITGTGFVQGSTILANLKAIPTVWMDATHLSGTLVLPTGRNSTVQITVSNPAPGASTSSAASVNVTFGAKLSFNTPSYFAEQSDDFAGPFPSWTNIKTAYGAVGDGIADDTAAIQNAINGMSDASPSSVLWLPAGTYKISKSLVFGHMHNFSFIGEDPGTTTLKWAGALGGTMLETDGSTYFRLARLGLDGNGLADTAENITTVTQYANQYYSTYNELSDQHIRGVQVGIRLGVDSETVVERIFFDHLATAGLLVGNFNTLNIFVNDSLFVGCGTGLSDAIDNGAGSYIVSNSYFVNSQTADMSIANTGLFTARHNTSVGSRTFFLSYELYGNSSEITLQNNTILDPATTPFQFGNLGPFMLIDNVVRLQNSALPIIQGSWSSYQKDVFSMGNSYTPNAGAVTQGYPSFQGRLVSYDDTTVPAGSIADVIVPTNVYVPPNNHSKVFEVGQLTGSAVQAAVNLAAASGTTKPVVHLAKGMYQVAQTISLPAGSDLELIGDDVTTSEMDWTGAAGSPMLKIPTSQVSVKYLKLYGDQGGDGILLSVADQPNTQVIVEQLGAVGGGDATGLSFDGMEHATAELASSYIYGTVTGVRTVGGAFRAAKEGTLGVTNYYSGSLQSTGSATSFDVSLGGKFMLQDNWHDYGLSSPQNFKLNGSGTVTEQGGGVFMTSSEPFEIDNFDGNVSLLGLAITGGFQLSPQDKHTNLLNLGLVGFTSNYLPATTGNATVENVLDSNIGAHIAQSDSPDAAWVRTMLAQTRSEYPIKRVAVASGASRIRLNRVSVLSANIGVHIAPDSIKSGLYYGLASGASMLANTAGACLSASGTAKTNQWLLMAAGEGDFEVVSRSTGLALGFAVSVDQTLAAEPVTGGYDQRWMVEKSGDGSYSLRNRQTDGLLSLPVPGGCAGLATGGSTNWTITAY